MAEFILTQAFRLGERNDHMKCEKNIFARGFTYGHMIGFIEVAGSNFNAHLIWAESKTLNCLCRTLILWSMQFGEQRIDNIFFLQI